MVWLRSWIMAAHWRRVDLYGRECEKLRIEPCATWWRQTAARCRSPSSRDRTEALVAFLGSIVCWNCWGLSRLYCFLCCVSSVFVSLAYFSFVTLLVLRGFVSIMQVHDHRDEKSGCTWSANLAKQKLCHPHFRGRVPTCFRDKALGSWHSYTRAPCGV